MSPDEISLGLGAQFGLTRSEAEVAVALSAGQIITEIAALRAVSVHTVRNQVKSAMAKTSSRRQADLIRLVEALRHAKRTSPPPGDTGRGKGRLVNGG